MSNEQAFQLRVEAAMQIIERYGGIDGAHHKQWVIDQVARALTGPRYDIWVHEMTSGENSDYFWEVGIAP